MKLASNFAPDDVLSDLLRVLRVRSTMYCYNQLHAPWGFMIDARAKDLPALRRRAEDDGTSYIDGATPREGPLASFHAVMSGACWLKVHGVDRPVRLGAGDLVLLPRGHAHEVSDEPGRTVISLEQLIASVGGARRLEYGGAGPRTDLLCGVFAIENQDTLPALQILPPIVLVQSENGHPPAWLEVVLDLLGREFETTNPGSEAAATRLMDFVLAQALRTVKPGYYDHFKTGLPALMDQEIAAALRLIHHQPGHAWTAGELAARVALSRSAFAARFRRLTGEPAIRYLARYRLARAADLLRTSNATLFDIASQTGYSSEAALSKSFRRTFGLPPGAYRKAHRRRSTTTTSVLGPVRATT